VVAEIQRWADVLVTWREREPDQIGDLSWAWVLPEAKLFEVLLPDGTNWGFPDLRLFCLDGDPILRVCIVTVQPDGRRYLEKEFLDLLRRVKDVQRQHPEPDP